MRRIPYPLGVALVVASLVTGAPAAIAQTNALPEKVQGTVAYVTGGIGLDEANAIEQVAAQYSLELEFARKAMPRNEYVSDVGVLIENQQGKPVLDTTSDGPFLLAKLPEGKYTVRVARHGDTKQRVVQIKLHNHERLVFVWEN
ncbi:carboxypeptidase regulatory-like domain-containing protein [Cupriavidus sp. CV2]|uniref:carboxypeptidase regulatory-like domain-containing protein n=1 Tax=Cupriavidus ulmosensis TaxID=3065913 RepID=UPI00296B56DB|nr:carboxypeptidase regulatory-like domain-containing protein [Cupriavidus sp. CV2]MDW3688986.1 carboxypeptidase regulatory-like domain-containing protein [Cupriavidus sp. CV2]